jgi:thiamine-monophosphate kinase
MTVSELGERRLLARIRARLPKPPPDVVVGVGDDAAVVAGPKNARTVLTTDSLVEGVHFERAFSSPADIGYKALAVNLSDLAAMGATPAWALLSLALPDSTAVEDVEALVDGLVGLASAQSVALVGGNLTRSPGPLVVDVTAVGTVHPRHVLMRDGGRAGDELFVSGSIGGGAAGLEVLRSVVGGRPSVVAHDEPLATNDQRLAAVIDRYRRPVPRVKLGRALAQARAARAAMDSSDGVADAVQHIAEASGCGVEVDAALLPIDEDARQWWGKHGQDSIVRALTGGDDYELVVAVPPKWRGRLRHATRRVADPALTRIGVLTGTRGEYVVVREGRKERLPGGFEHW